MECAREVPITAAQIKEKEGENMKRILLLTLTVLTLVCMLISCSGSDSAGGNNAGGNQNGGSTQRPEGDFIYAPGSAITVIYNGEEWSLSALAKVLLKRNSTVQGTLHFSYNGETISDLRERLEEENNY